MTARGKSLAARGFAMERLNGALKSTDHPVIEGLRMGKNYVPGKGSLRPKVVFVGEAPGRNENALREPFIGRSGQLLDQMICMVDLSRYEDCYITNCVKWWPTEPSGSTRPPSPQEKTLLRPWLLREIAITEQWSVVALGKHAASLFLSEPRRGVWQAAPGLPLRVLPLLHPAAALYQSSIRPTMFKEFETVLEVIR